MSVKTNITIYMSDIVFACKENSCKKTMTDCVQSLKAKLIQNTTIRSQDLEYYYKKSRKTGTFRLLQDK